MDIILDTNIYRSDIKLKSNDFDVMLDYLAKTNSSVIIPQIIIDEVSGLYKRTLIERINEYKKSINNLKLTVADKSCVKDEININVEEELLEYVKYIKSKLRIIDKNIIPYNNDYLPVISNRAINRQKPSGEKGQGFRDTLIWLTITDYCKKQNDKQIVFISQNVDDFAHKDGINLHESLLDECNLNDIQIHYYKSIKDFIEHHSTKINFINDIWINEAIPDNLAEDLLRDELHKTRYDIPRAIMRNTENQCTGNYNIGAINSNVSNEYFVYELADNTIIINVPASFEVEVEYDHLIDHWHKIQNESIGLPHLNGYTVNSSYTYLTVDAYISITVKDKEIIDIRIEDCDLY